MQRNKGKRGEREVSALIRDHTEWDAQRRVRQHDGDSDLLGVPGWSVEVKNCSSARLGDVRRWWLQCIEQAGTELPVLVYKRQRGEWRAVWPVSVALTKQSAEMWRDFEWTCEGSVQAWAAVARETAGLDR